MIAELRIGKKEMEGGGWEREKLLNGICSIGYMSNQQMKNIQQQGQGALKSILSDRCAVC